MFPTKIQKCSHKIFLHNHSSPAVKTNGPNNSKQNHKNISFFLSIIANNRIIFSAFGVSYEKLLLPLVIHLYKVSFSFL